MLEVRRVKKVCDVPDLCQYIPIQTGFMFFIIHISYKNYFSCSTAKHQKMEEYILFLKSMFENQIFLSHQSTGSCVNMFCK